METNEPTKNVKQAIGRGVLGRCPNCGTGKLFAGYLAVRDRCESCDEPLSEYKTADLPALFTILFVGILLVPTLWVGFAVFRPDPLLLFGYMSVLIIVLTLVMLRLVKGANVGYFWAIDERDRGA
ncbi:DUF983 domain-containing protein [Roseovarius sp. E0-M6]|uniref:DUF983 domain-containing protein n=1 Tax=Roseovarius sp. E0-M6 TaxID=3127118 RepID=UPI0030105A75